MLIVHEDDPLERLSVQSVFVENRFDTSLSPPISHEPLCRQEKSMLTVGEAVALKDGDAVVGLAEGARDGALEGPAEAVVEGHLVGPRETGGTEGVEVVGAGVGGVLVGIEVGERLQLVELEADEGPHFEDQHCPHPP